MTYDLSFHLQTYHSVVLHLQHTLMTLREQRTSVQLLTLHHTQMTPAPPHAFIQRVEALERPLPWDP